jgi:hypothetical protein
MKITAFIFLLSLIAWAPEVTAQTRTLREMVAERNGPVNRRSSSNMLPVTLEELIASADLIVLARVRATTSYVTADGTDIHTDLTLTDVQHIYPLDAGQSTKPGLVAELTVTQLGGEVVINGHDVSSTYADLPPLQRGTFALFILNRVDDKLFIARKFLGVFGVQGDRTVPLTSVSWFADKHRGIGWAEFVGTVTRIAQRRKQKP